MTWGQDVVSTEIENKLLRNFCSNLTCSFHWTCRLKISVCGRLEDKNGSFTTNSLISIGLKHLLTAYNVFNLCSAIHVLISTEFSWPKLSNLYLSYRIKILLVFGISTCFYCPCWFQLGAWLEPVEIARTMKNRDGVDGTQERQTKNNCTPECTTPKLYHLDTAANRGQV